MTPEGETGRLVAPPAGGHPRSFAATCRDAIAAADLVVERGYVTQLVGLTIEATGPRADVGQLVWLHGQAGRVLAEVVGFRDRRILVMPLGEMAGIGPGTAVTRADRALSVRAGDGLLGRVLDALGRPFDEKGPLPPGDRRPVQKAPPHPLARRRIDAPLSLGIRAVDALLTCGRGQRLGIFAGSGLGKSTLMGMIARHAAADVNCIALIGERGREVREFLERDLGPEGLARSVVVVATSDQPALVRLKGAFVATAIAEYFRDQGRHVLFMMDSVTRVAAAQREVGLAVGEPPATKGYPPSVFGLLARLLERTGAGKVGTVTGLYTVLVEGDDLTDPVADSVRSILDGHIVLSRSLAERGHYPAIDVLASVSRAMRDVVDESHWNEAMQLKEMLATLREAEDLVNIGAYVSGSNPKIDAALLLRDQIEAFLRQSTGERVGLTAAREGLARLLARPQEAGDAPAAQPTGRLAQGGQR